MGSSASLSPMDENSPLQHLAKLSDMGLEHLNSTNSLATTTDMYEGKYEGKSGVGVTTDASPFESPFCNFITPKEGKTQAKAKSLPSTPITLSQNKSYPCSANRLTGAGDEEEVGPVRSSHGGGSDQPLSTVLEKSGINSST